MICRHRSKSIDNFRGSSGKAWRVILERIIVSNDLESCSTKNVCMHVLLLVLFMCCERQLCVCLYDSGTCVKFDDKPKMLSKSIKSEIY